MFVTHRLCFVIEISVHVSFWKLNVSWQWRQKTPSSFDACFYFCVALLFCVCKCEIEIKFNYSICVHICAVRSVLFVGCNCVVISLSFPPRVCFFIFRLTIIIMARESHVFSWCAVKFQFSPCHQLSQHPKYHHHHGCLCVRVCAFVCLQMNVGKYLCWLRVKSQRICFFSLPHLIMM